MHAIVGPFPNPALNTLSLQSREIFRGSSNPRNVRIRGIRINPSTRCACAIFELPRFFVMASAMPGSFPRAIRRKYSGNMMDETKVHRPKLGDRRVIRCMFLRSSAATKGSPSSSLPFSEFSWARCQRGTIHPRCDVLLGLRLIAQTELSPSLDSSGNLGIDVVERHLFARCVRIWRIHDGDSIARTSSNRD